MIFFSLLSLLELFANIGRGLSPILNFKWILIFISAASLLILTLRLKRRDIVQRSGVYISAFILIPIAWMGGTGIMSPSVAYSFLILIMINYMISGVERVVLNLLYVGVNMVLIYLACTLPELFEPISAEEQLNDWMVSVPTVFIFSAVLLATFEKAYERERSTAEKNSLILKKKSQTDVLTGLYNRAHLIENWPKLISSHRRQNESLSFIMFDIDFFKNYNDHYGHQQGDSCLVSFSRILEDNMERDGDFVYRLGGEEFLVVLSQTGLDGAVSVVERIMSALEDAAIPHNYSAVRDYVTATAGISSFRVGSEDVDFEKMLEQADLALYRGKQQGRNRIVCYSEKMEKNTSDKI